MFQRIRHCSTLISINFNINTLWCTATPWLGERWATKEREFDLGAKCLGKSRPFQLRRPAQTMSHMSRCHVILGTVEEKAFDVSMRSLMVFRPCEPRRWSRNKRKTRMKHHSHHAEHSCRAFMPSIHAESCRAFMPMLSNDSTCYLWFSKCLYLWFEIILEIIFYLKLLLYAEECAACAEPSPSHRPQELFFTDAAPDHSLGVSSKTAHHIPAIPATRQPKASTDRWSDGPISSVSYTVPHLDVWLSIREV